MPLVILRHMPHVITNLVMTKCCKVLIHYAKVYFYYVNEEIKVNQTFHSLEHRDDNINDFP
jgi:hypothetical protein